MYMYTHIMVKFAVHCTCSCLCKSLFVILFFDILDSLYNFVFMCILQV